MTIDEKTQKKIIEMKSQGTSLREMSDALGIHHLTIHHFIRSHELANKMMARLEGKNSETTKNENGGNNMTPTYTTTSFDPLVEMEKARKIEMYNDSVELRNRKTEAQIKRDEADADRQRMDLERQRIEIEKIRQQNSQNQQVQQSLIQNTPEKESEMMKMFKELNQMKMFAKMMRDEEGSTNNPQMQMMMQQINDLKTELKSKDRDNSFMEAMKMNQSNMVNPERWLESQERLSEKHLQLIAERQKMEIDRLRDELKLIAGQRQSEDALGNSLSKKIGEYIEKNMDVAKVLGKDEGEKSLINDPEFIKTLVQGGVGLMSAMGQRKQQNEYQPPQPQEYVQPVTPVRPAGAYQAQQRVLKPEPNGHSIKSQKFEDINFMRPVDYDNTDLNNQNTDLSGFEHNFLNENPS